MKKILILMFFISSVSLFGGKAVLNALKGDRLKKIKIVESMKNKHLSRLKEEYLKKLEALMIKLTRKGDLDAALAVKAEIKAVRLKKY